MSSPDEKTSAALAEPNQAMLGYLQTLLDEIPADSPQTAVLEAVVQPSVETRIVETVTPVLEVEPAVETAAESALPEWAASRFQLLYFQSGGVDLSLPLVTMRNICKLESSLTELPGMPDWHMGILRARGDNVNVVNLTRLMLPATERTASRPAFVLVLEDSDWGLACDGLGQAGSVLPEQVRWRRGAATPKYICGVQRENLVPILNTREVLDALRRPDR